MIFDKSITCEITLIDPPSNDKYSPLYNKVKANVRISFADTVDLCYIKCGLLGVCDVKMYVMKEKLDIEKKTIEVERETFTDKHSFLNTNSTFEFDSKYETDVSDDGIKTTKILAGDIIESEFTFKIPSDAYIPSSCKNLGSFNGHFSIFYQVYVEVYKIGGIFNKRPKQKKRFTCNIYYQSGKDRNITESKSELNYNKTHTFKDKIKTYYFDEDLQILVPTDLTKNHRKTRFIRKLWTEQLKDENFKKITKTIPLEFAMKTNSSIDMYSPLIQQFQSSLISNLKSINVASNKTTDFIFDGQSTNLGVFKIESLTIKALYNVSVKCQDHIYKTAQGKLLLETTFDDLVFDITYFDFDEEKRECKELIALERLNNNAQVDLSQSLMDILKTDTIFCSGKTSGWYDNTVSIKYKWIVTDGLFQKKEYKFITAASPDIIFDDVSSFSDNEVGSIANSAFSSATSVEEKFEKDEPFSE